MMHTSPKKIIWLIFQGDQLLMKKVDEMLALFDEADISSVSTLFIRQHQFIENEDMIIHCAEISAEFSLSHSLQLLSLRKALEYLGDDWYHVLSRAFSIINWDRNHQFCGRCGNRTVQKTKIFERICETCGMIFYPRISPSVIVRIERGDEILLARGHHFLPGVFGLIAGFVEAGENVEDAIHREVFEEIKIKIKNLRYFGSQTWPFPDSLMLGFTAEYDSGDIEINPDEIAEANWYHYLKLPGRPSTSISIAAKLIEDFVEQKRRMT